MTIKELLAKYTQMVKDNYETVFISEVVNDLWQMERQNVLRRETRKRKLTLKDLEV